MTARIRGAAALLFCLLLFTLLPAAAQLPSLAGSAAKGSATETATRDPLDRGTPRRAISAFIRAAHRDDMVAAMRYVQDAGRAPARTQQLVRGLNTLMDRHFRQPLTAISDAPEGALDDGLPLDRERIGPLKVGSQELYIELVRVEDPVSGPVWLISWNTLAQVPDLQDEDDRSWAQQWLPAALSKRALFDFSFADLVTWAAALVLPLLLLPVLLRLLHALLRRTVPQAHRAALDTWYDTLRWPVVVTLLPMIQLATLPAFGPTVSFRIAYALWMAVAVVVAFTWVLHRFLSLAFGRAGAHLQDRGRTGARSVMLLAERVLNVLLALAALLAVLALVGFEVRTVLTGLGIIGVALALGAQKTIENILGGMMLLGDEAIAVGDLCRVNNRLGTVEDITLRSVRFRTLEHTLLSIPAGVLAQAELENYATRDKILAQHRLRLHYATTAAQLRAIREEIAAGIATHPLLEHPVSRVRIVEFGPTGVELEIFAYVLTRDLPQFLEVREQLLLHAAEIVESAGARFADPAPWTAEPAAGTPR